MKTSFMKILLLFLVYGTSIVNAQKKSILPFPHPKFDVYTVQNGSFLLSMIALNNSKHLSVNQYFRNVEQENVDLTLPVTTNTDPALENQLISFKATPEFKSIKLDWLTEEAMEKTIFELERSTNEEPFNMITQAAQPLKNSSTLCYSVVDDKVEPGTIYSYRLKYKDNLGELQYSNIVNAVTQVSDVFTVGNFVPNPSTNDIAVRVIAPEQSTVTLALYTMDGKLVLKKKYELSAGIADLAIEMNGMLPGNYLAQFVTNDQKEVRKVVKVQ